MPTRNSASNEDKYTATSWGGVGLDLEMPSGQLARVRKPGVQQLISAGVLHSLDSLTPIAEGLINTAEGANKKAADGSTDEALAKLMENPDALDSMMHIIDKVVVHTVLKPTVEMTPNDVTRRKEGVIYADMIDMEDKFFIFQYVTGGTTSVEQFRKESEESLGGLAAIFPHALSSQ